MFSKLPKPLSFAFLGAIGCFLAAVCVGEPLHLILEPDAPPPPEKPMVDVMFVLDATASMQFAIDGTKSGIQGFANELQAKDLNARVGLVAFRDRVWEPPKLDICFVLDVSGSMQDEIDGIRDGIESFALSLEKMGLDVQIGLVAFRNSMRPEAIQTLSFKTGFFTTNYREFSSQVGTLSAGGGGDDESSYLGLATAVEQQYRKDAEKILILITDEPPLIPDAHIRSTDHMVEVLKQLHQGKLYCVIDSYLKHYFTKLGDALPIEFFPLSESGERTDFSVILPSVVEQIATDFGTGTDTASTHPESSTVVSSEPEILDFEGTSFTDDPVIFRDKLASIHAVGGGDIPESSFDALAVASDLGFRDDAEKVLVLITDAPPRIPDKEMQNSQQVAAQLALKGIDQFHVVTMKEFESQYRDIQSSAEISGMFFSLADAASGTQAFDGILPDIGREIAVASIKGLQSGTEYASDQKATVFALVGLWAGILSCGICLMLICGQNASLRRQIISWREIATGGGGSLLTGVLSGIAGQILFQYIMVSSEGPQVVEASNYSQDIFSRVCAWMMLGGMLGGTMAFFVPNLKWYSAAIGGAIGGGIGAAGFLMASSIGYGAGRVLGAASLGLLIGLMVALSEIVSRSFYLEISYGGNEKTMVNLGGTPVTVGSDRTCTVWVSGGAAVHYRYVMESGVVFCNDVVLGSSTPVNPNESNRINHVTLTVRSTTEGNAPPTALPTVAPPPPPSRRSAPDGSATSSESTASPSHTVDRPLGSPQPVPLPKPTRRATPQVPGNKSQGGDHNTDHSDTPAEGRGKLPPPPPPRRR